MLESSTELFVGLVCLKWHHPLPDVSYASTWGLLCPCLKPLFLPETSMYAPDSCFQSSTRNQRRSVGFTATVHPVRSLKLYSRHIISIFDKQKLRKRLLHDNGSIIVPLRDGIRDVTACWRTRLRFSVWRKQTRSCVKVAQYCTNTEIRFIVTTHKCFTNETNQRSAWKANELNVPVQCTGHELDVPVQPKWIKICCFFHPPCHSRQKGISFQACALISVSCSLIRFLKNYNRQKSLRIIPSVTRYFWATNGAGAGSTHTL